VSKNVAMFVDVANMYYAARGQDVDVDYVALLKHATKGRDLIRAYAYTGLDPENENQRKFIDFLGKNGYKPVVKDIRKFGDGRMKANLDIELVVDLFRLADRMDIAVIVSGDGDFAPAIRALQDKGVRAEVISFKPNTSSDLIAVADEFVDIMKVASISRAEGRAKQRSMSAPEMPAKEVTPEFGFREASPSVAAAALAALKSGAEPAARGRGRGTTSRRSTVAKAEESEEAAPVAASAAGTAESEEGTRRRRRRRGGRGRGRGRREDEAAPAAAGGEEIGWEEFDDLAQLDGADAEREYGFDEADPETLAELGLSPEEIEAMTAKADDAEAEEKPKTRRRSTRSKKAETDSDATDAAEGEAEEKPKTRRRSTRSKKAETDSQDAAEGEAEEKPKTRRRSTRSKKVDADTETADAGAEGEARASADATDEAGQPQGIWGRFRSARKPREAPTS
jgi:uncharacterized LabA/DUF88 family protein